MQPFSYYILYFALSSPAISVLCETLIIQQRPARLDVTGISGIV